MVKIVVNEVQGFSFNIYCSKCSLWKYQRFNIQMQGNYNEENTQFVDWLNFNQKIDKSTPFN